MYTIKLSNAYKTFTTTAFALLLLIGLTGCTDGLTDAGVEPAPSEEVLSGTRSEEGSEELQGLVDEYNAVLAEVLDETAQVLNGDSEELYNAFQDAVAEYQDGALVSVTFVPGREFHPQGPSILDNGEGTEGWTVPYESLCQQREDVEACLATSAAITDMVKGMGYDLEVYAFEVVPHDYIEEIGEDRIAEFNAGVAHGQYLQASIPTDLIPPNTDYPQCGESTANVFIRAPQADVLYTSWGTNIVHLVASGRGYDLHTGQLLEDNLIWRDITLDTSGPVLGTGTSLPVDYMHPVNTFGQEADITWELRGPCGASDRVTFQVMHAPL